VIRLVLEMWSYPFMRHALGVGLLVGMLCSWLSFFVVVNRLSFAGVGISHSAFAGVALALLLGLPPIWGASVLALAAAVAVGYLKRTADCHEDTAIGIFFALAMALGVVLASTSGQFTGDVFGYLFGSILALNRGDLVVLGGVAALVLGAGTLVFPGLLFQSFDAEMARAYGVPTSLLYYGMLVGLALAIVVSVKVVGAVLVSALLVIPAATGRVLATGYRGMMALSLATGVVSVIVGLSCSYAADWPPGCTIVLAGGAIFFLSLARQALARFTGLKGTRPSEYQVEPR